MTAHKGCRPSEVSVHFNAPQGKHPPAPEMLMFEALIQLEVGPEEGLAVTRVADATPAEMTQALLNTANLLHELGLPSDEDIDERMQRQEAREAFSAINYDPDDEHQKAQLARLKSVKGVHHLVAMLSAYDFEFVERAKELRGYTVAKILELTESNDPKVRLKALKLLGDVTEVGLFTTKVEVKNTHRLDEDEVNRRLEQKLKEMLVVDTTAKVVPEKL